MEWISNLFGGAAKTPSPSIPEIPSIPTPSPDKKKEGDDALNLGFDIKGFDPRGLERAAKASKELSDSPLNKEILQLQREEIKAKQADALKAAEEAKAKQQAFAVEHARVSGEERRKNIEYEHQAQQQAAQYQDKLARQRQQDELQAQSAMRGQEMRRQEETAQRIEEMRKRTLDYEASLRKQTEEARAIAESKGRILQERENFDLILKRAKFESEEYRTTVLNGIQEFGKVMGRGVQDFLSDRSKILSSLSIVSMGFLSFYLAKNGTKFGFKQLEARLGKPPLVRETSRNGILRHFRHPVQLVKSIFTAKDVMRALDGVVFEPQLLNRLTNLAKSTLNTRKNHAPFRHALFYGAPGTGKTLFAKRLAKESGMDYAIMTGGDIAPLGRDAVSQIHTLFDWAEKSPKGLLIFVDEADAFLRKRSDEKMSEDTRNALNAFLYRTGTETKNYMLVFASNLPDQLDFAVLDRADEAVEFTLPGEAERVALLKYYFDKHVRKASEQSSGLFQTQTKIKLSPLVKDWDAKLVEMAKQLKGFSGREIAKFAISLQANAYATANAEMDEALVDRVLKEKLFDHVEKKKWQIGAEKFGSEE